MRPTSKPSPLATTRSASLRRATSAVDGSKSCGSVPAGRPPRLLPCHRGVRGQVAQDAVGGHDQRAAVAGAGRNPAARDTAGRPRQPGRRRRGRRNSPTGREWFPFTCRTLTERFPLTSRGRHRRRHDARPTASTSPWPTPPSRSPRAGPRPSSAQRLGQVDAAPRHRRPPPAAPRDHRGHRRGGGPARWPTSPAPPRQRAPADRREVVTMGRYAHRGAWRRLRRTTAGPSTSRWVGST